MILVVAATQMEMEPFIELTQEGEREYLSHVSGVGPIETAVTVGKVLAESQKKISAVLQFGIGGAFVVPPDDEQVDLLSVCLASKEVIGDVGICFPNRIDYFGNDLSAPAEFPLESDILTEVKNILGANAIPYNEGIFITVSAVSGTLERGEMLRSQWNGLCENMEGGAVARLCSEYGLPMVELRVISNLVEERDTSRWQIGPACRKAGELAALLIKEL